MPSGPRVGRRPARRSRGRASRRGTRRPTALIPSSCCARQEVDRVPELVPIRHERMLVSPFAFYRGAAVIMACRPRDRSAFRAAGAVLRRRAPRQLRRVRRARPPDGVRRQRLRRDEPRSLRVGREAPRRQLRDRASGARLRGRSRSRSPSTRRSTYREAMTEFASMRNLDVWYARLDAAGGHRPLGGA